ncbi:Conserved exported protein of uncharacterised function [Mycobacterium xenopi]|uniref:DUF732 domain-containing protein n=2 Tax=Mycobacterium xenopi TaxID=1789 RepID=A0AAD1M1P3_MYCXE|nr:hypothetical protein I552_5349 [Mycobacterium xenopi 3993]BBU23289.1 hypothetical protein MYXE_30790 [Mycobacterium xenopi]SPX88937.1 Conserved exported protein of uncharacterised function [Mycobacterium xenopi]
MLIGAIAAMLLAAPAHADPAGDDANFLHSLDRLGITYQSPDSVIASGRAVCQLLDDGKSQKDIVQQLRQANPGFTLNSAKNFTVAAATAYCPRYL